MYILRITAILKQNLLRFFAIFALYTNICVTLCRTCAILLKNVQCCLSTCVGPFHFISTPPLWKRSVKIYPLRNQRSKVPTRASLQKLPKFSFPLRKKPIFFRTPRKYSRDQRRRRSDPLTNDDQGPLRKSLPSGGCGY